MGAIDNKEEMRSYDPLKSQHPVRDEATYTGFHEELHPVMDAVEKATGLVHSESMHMTNDPRFFQSSVLNKRLAAFSGLSVVSGLMIGTCSDVISMKKDMNLSTLEGNLQLLSFSILTFVMFANIVATYVGVAQIYHAVRLETAGPTGFEMATSYYLNPNIVAWRHIAVKCMLNSLPLFLISTGIRIEEILTGRQANLNLLLRTLPATL